MIRQHWFISRLNGASITAGGFSPHKNNMLVLTTSSNHVYVFDVETKELGEWSKHKEFTMPRRFQEFPGEVIGISFPPSPSSSIVVIYSSRYLAFNLLDSSYKMCNPLSEKSPPDLPFLLLKTWERIKYAYNFNHALFCWWCDLIAYFLLEFPEQF